MYMRYAILVSTNGRSMLHIFDYVLHVMCVLLVQASQLYQHMREAEGEGGESHDAVVWDAAPVSHSPGPLPPSDHTDVEETEEAEGGAGREDTNTPAERVSVVDV